MIFELRKGIALLLTLSLVACQTPPIGNATQPNGGFNIQSHSKPGLRPFVECVKVNRDASFTAYFGYENTLGKTVTLPIGGQNKILETGGDSGRNHGRDDEHNREGRDGHDERDRNPGFSTKSNQSQKGDARKDDKDDKDRRDRDEDKGDNKHPNNRRDRQDRGQPTVFPPGRTSAWPQAPLALVFSQERITWQLGENKATASVSDTTQRCPTEIPTPISYSGSSRKTVIPAQVLNLNRQNPQTLNFNLQAAESLSYRFLLNLRHAGSSRVQGLQIYLNGQEIPHAFNANSPDMVLELSGGLLAGQNRLEFSQTGAQNVPLEILLDGYLDPLNVPGAIFSQLPEDRFLLQKPHRKGKLYLKFIEGMKVRIKQANTPQFEDLNGISLTALNQGLQQLGVTEIAQAISAPTSLLDQEEQASEAYFQTDVPNQNLFYRLSVSEDANPLLLRMSLRSFPYVEEAFPEYVLDEAYAPAEYVFAADPNSGYFKNKADLTNNIRFPLDTGIQVLRNQFLINTGVMHGKFLSKTSETNAAYASTATPGAWNYWDAKGTIPGDPGVKIAVLDGGFLLDGFKNDNFLNNSTYPSQHEDLDNPNIQPKSNVDPSKYPAGKGTPYLDIGHGTGMLSLIGASHTPALFSLNTSLLANLNTVPTNQPVVLPPNLSPLRTAFVNAGIRFDGAIQIQKIANAVNEEMWVLKDSQKQWSIQRDGNRINVYDVFPKGGAGIAANTTIYPIHFQYTGAKEENRCLGGTAPAGQCHGLADSIAYAVKLNSNVIVLSSWLDPYTIEADPLVRSEIAKAITQKVTVVLASGNDTCSTMAKHTDNATDYANNEKKYNACIAKYPNGMDIRRVRASRLVMGQESSLLLTEIPTLLGSSVVFSGGIILPLRNTRLTQLLPFSSSTFVLSDDYTLDMPDIGSIIVGATNLDGSGRIKGKVELPKGPGKDGDAAYKKQWDYAWGITNGNAHGIDVSAPADAYNYTAIFNKNDAPTASGYDSFGGSSGASAIVGGIVGLMMSQNPSYKNNPKEVRNILRNTNRDDINNQMAGLINAYEAVKKANNNVLPLPAPTSSGGLNTLSLLSPPAGATPGGYGVKAFYDPNNSGPITARAGDVIGFFVQNARTRNISIEIQGKNAVITANHDDLLSMTVPADLIVGNVDAVFKSDEGEFKIENLINYTSPFPEVVKFSKPTIFANGSDVVDGYITVKDANGQPAPDGTPYYIQLVPTQLGLYPDLTMIHPETGQQYGGRWTTVEQVLPVKNGKIHIQAKLNAPIAPYAYTYDFANNLPNVFTWPHAQAPSFQVQVCNPAYSSSKPGYGYYCGQQLFPQAGNTRDGRLYAVHAYSFNPQIHHVTAGSPKRTFTIGNIQDILGNPVPVGTVLYFNQTYYGNVSNPNGNDIYWGVAVTTPGQVEIAYEPFQRIYCGAVGMEEYVYMTSVQGAAGNPLYWLVGNPIYFRYVAC